jgi:hypothetical protein
MPDAVAPLVLETALTATMVFSCGVISLLLQKVMGMGGSGPPQRRSGERRQRVGMRYGDLAATSGPATEVSPRSWLLMSKRSVPSRPIWSFSK